MLYVIFLLNTIAKWLFMYLPSEDNVVCVRLLRPGFEYPTHGFKHREALYYSSEDAVFLVTKRQSSKYGEGVYTEVAIWNPDEIRLLGTLTLSVPEGGGIPVFAPWHVSLLRDIPLSSDLSSIALLNLVWRLQFHSELRMNNQTETNTYSVH